MTREGIRKPPQGGVRLSPEFMNWSDFIFQRGRFDKSYYNQRRRQDFGSGGGNILGGRPSRGSGGGAPPPDAGEFSKMLKNFLRKLQ